ncbi:GNAT family N-acetyltransferase [Vitiosangium sp. GDMCC 1.1324]|uniref:GNAT family N-acetyltransferase n=1 Tax=Vitiosangium sp. (strain GDMCC 1.1324) TaxID=2138576 RepID=UPI00130EA5BA|nr:GNAT family N-acetyltransferase [Vitiosangium sp. GDMCC 1.1324]
MDITIRRAGLEDAEGMTRVHLESWRSSYRGLLPQEYLEGLDFEERLAGWRRGLADPDAGVFVAEEPDTGRIVGLCAVGKNRPPPESLPGYRGELYAIYLVEEVKRRGVGRALFQRGTGWLRENGLVPFILWVLKDNAAARGFYERLGGRLGGEQWIELGGHSYAEVAYVWEA